MKRTAYQNTEPVATLEIINKDEWERKLHPSLVEILEKSIKRIDDELLHRQHIAPNSGLVVYRLTNEKNKLIAAYVLHNTATLNQMPNLMIGIHTLLEEANRQLKLPEPNAKFWERNKRKKAASDH